MRDVRPKDLHVDSPYNTYEHRGLPPGPIANPGEASLRAAIDPPPTDYLYFVANAEGGHNFSKTFAEHGRNIDVYRHKLAEQRRNAARNAPREPDALHAGTRQTRPQRASP